MRPRVCEDEPLPCLSVGRIGRDEVGLRSGAECNRIERKVEKWTKSLSCTLANIGYRESDRLTREEELDRISDLDSETTREVSID
jgi:hypothetical protein